MTQAELSFKWAVAESWVVSMMRTLDKTWRS